MFRVNIHSQPLILILIVHVNVIVRETFVISAHFGIHNENIAVEIVSGSLVQIFKPENGNGEFSGICVCWSIGV